ncbi:MAG TPA: type II toxin-antitoxin system VapC family toxin [Candidatus Bathyarchaeia archaeon]|jgi:tRNA(fMet)-specific endonuclease VapC|nr:type II toxin-antitoxin system VapC family toxin [Candidatus Bathyarchaeia archaeon]
MVCLDTTFLVDLVRAKPEAEKKLLYYIENDERITTTPVNAAELYDGAYSLKGRRQEADRVRGLLEHLELLDISLAVCEKYGRLTNELKSKGSPIGDMDTLVASTALAHRQILLTRNKAHFEKIPGLIIETW